MRLFSTSSNMETPSSREDTDNVPPALSSSSIYSGIAWVGGDEKLRIDTFAFGFNQDKPMSNFIYVMGASNISNASTGRYPRIRNVDRLGASRKRGKQLLMASS
jgi:hypothetical protein